MHLQRAQRRRRGGRQRRVHREQQGWMDGKRIGEEEAGTQFAEWGESSGAPDILIARVPFGLRPGPVCTKRQLCIGLHTVRGSDSSDLSTWFFEHQYAFQIVRVQLQVTRRRPAYLSALRFAAQTSGIGGRRASRLLQVL